VLKNESPILCVLNRIPPPPSPPRPPARHLFSCSPSSFTPPPPLSHSPTAPRRKVLTDAAAWAAAAAISGVPTHAGAGYDTSKLADEWEGFLPERIVKRGGKDIRIVQEFNAKKKNGLAVYEVSLYVSPYLSHSGMRDRWRCSHCSVLEIVCKGDVSAALSSPLC
jgi:hypothetical protein